MKGIKGLLATVGILAAVLAGTFSTAAADFWEDSTVAGTDYDVEVTASDGGVNLRRAPGIEHEKCREDMIPNGVILHVTKEAEASNGNGWGLTEYEGQGGWIALTQVTRIEVEPAVENNAGIVFERMEDGQKEYATVTSYDAQGQQLWQYTTDAYELAQCIRVSGLGQKNGYYYLVEDGAVVALEETTGLVAWRNEEYIGAATEKGYLFDEEGNLYISGYLGPDLFVVDKNGRTMYRKDSFDSDVLWPYEMEWKKEDVLRIHYEADLNSGGDDVWMEADVKNLW